MTPRPQLRDASRRIWRLRKRNDVVDAELHAGDKRAAACFFYNGVLAYRRIWPTRRLAAAEIDRRRTEMEREGWQLHW